MRRCAPSKERTSPNERRALEAVDRILNRGGDADDVLRAVVAELEHRPGITWAGILFLENGLLALGPEAGAAGRHAGSRARRPTRARRWASSRSTVTPKRRYSSGWRC